MMARKYFVRRDVQAACDVCHGHYQWTWTSKNAQAIAAKHHDKTGHTVRVDVEMTIVYGNG